MFYLIPVFLLIHSTISSCPPPCHCTITAGQYTLHCVTANLTSIPVIAGRDGVNTVQAIWLDGNNLIKLLAFGFFNAGLTSLQKLSLRNCNIKLLPENLFYSLTNLEDLNLSGNLISDLLPHQFSRLPALRRLDLSHNALSSISSSTLASLSPSLSFLSLTGNVLTSLPPSSFPLLSRLPQLQLADNPWHCDCRLAGLHAQLARNNAVPVQTACSRPLAMLDLQWSDLLSSDFVCKPAVSVQQVVTTWPGKTASLQCNVTSSHGTEVVWLARGRVIHNNAYPSQDRDPHLYQQFGIMLTEHRHSEYVSTFLSVFSIQNMSRASSGVYSCLARNKVGMDQKQVTLRLQENNEGLSDVKNSLVIIGVSASVSLVVVLIVIIIILCLWRRFKTSGSSSASSNTSNCKLERKQ